MTEKELRKEIIYMLNKGLTKRRRIMNNKNIKSGQPVLACPLCDCTMEYKKGKTHMWICPDCPAVVFEYIDINDLNDLYEQLEKDIPNGNQIEKK